MNEWFNQNKYSPDVKDKKIFFFNKEKFTKNNTKKKTHFG